MNHKVGIILLLMVWIAGVTTQEMKGFSWSTSVGCGVGLGSGSPVSYSWRALGHYNLSDRWALGVGTGLSYDEKVCVPLYGDVKFQIGRVRTVTPFVSMSAGYSWALSRRERGGVYLNPSIGADYLLTDRIGLRVALGYEWQPLSRLRQQTDSYFSKEFVERVVLSALSLRVGVCF